MCVIYSFSYINITHLSPSNRTTLLFVLNKMFCSGVVPDEWKCAIVVPLLKQNKPADKPDSYRPISLTSCLAKAMEKMLNARLKWYLDKEKLLPKYQAGFRSGFTTADHIIHLEADVKMGFNKKKITTAVFLDLTKAYDHTWHVGLLYKLTKMKVQGTALLWLKNFLQDRTITVRSNNAYSDTRTLTKGVPQGSVLSPLLSNVMMSDFPHPDKDIELELFADDIEFHTTTDSTEDSQLVLQPYIDEIDLWSYDWRLFFSVDKCKSLTFTRRKKPEPEPILLLSGVNIEPVDTFKFLGITFDKRLNWSAHISSLITSIQRLANLLKIMAGRKISLKLHLLTRLYKALIRSKIDYSAPILASLPPSRIATLEKTQNQMLRIILGCQNTTPVALLQLETGIEPIAARLDKLASRYVLKLGNKPWNPAYESCFKMVHFKGDWHTNSIPALLPTINKIKTFVKNIFSTPPTDFPSVPNLPPWKRLPLTIKYFPLNKRQASKDPRTTRATFSSMTVDDNNPSHVSAFTDGSRSDTSQSAACGVYIPRIQFKRSWKLNKLTSSYTAELMGIRQALHILYDHNQEEITIYSDSQAAIQAISDYKFDSNPAIPEIIETIMNHHAAGTKINLAWIPSHCGIHGNEEADRLAAEGCTSPSRGHIDNTISIQEIIAAFNLVWRSKVINNSVGQSSNIAVTSRFRSFGPLVWHLHKSKQHYSNSEAATIV